MVLKTLTAWDLSSRSPDNAVTRRCEPGCQIDARVDDEGRLILTPVLYEPEEFLTRRPPKPARAASPEEMEAGVRKGAARGRV